MMFVSIPHDAQVCVRVRSFGESISRAIDPHLERTHRDWLSHTVQCTRTSSPRARGVGRRLHMCWVRPHFHPWFTWNMRARVAPSRVCSKHLLWVPCTHFVGVTHSSVAFSVHVHMCVLPTLVCHRWHSRVMYMSCTCAGSHREITQPSLRDSSLPLQIKKNMMFISIPHDA